MLVPLQITFRGIPPSAALEEHIRDRIGKLEHQYPQMRSCRVVAELPHQRGTRGRHFTLRLEIGVPGAQIVVNQDHHEDIYVALRDAFQAASRQLDEHAARIRREVKNRRLSGDGE